MIVILPEVNFAQIMLLALTFLMLLETYFPFLVLHALDDDKQ
jgi:hypothetical protein